jgi:hypothetical protein
MSPQEIADGSTRHRKSDDGKVRIVQGGYRGERGDGCVWRIEQRWESSDG